MEDLVVTVCDGKYTFTKSSTDYRVRVLRYGEPWLIIDAGCNAILALMRELSDLRDKYDGQSE